MSGAVFNIGSQQAGAIYQSGGDQTIHHGGGTMTVGALSAVADLRTALAATPLPDAARREAEGALRAVESELGRPAPDKAGIANRLERLVDVVAPAGAVATAAQQLVPPLRALASWLGSAGAGLLGLLA